MDVNYNCLMVILDLEIFFINIPVEETIDNIITDLTLTTVKICNFEKDNLKNLIHMTPFFVFDNDYYCKINCCHKITIETHTWKCFFMSLRKKTLHLSPWF